MAYLNIIAEFENGNKRAEINARLAGNFEVRYFVNGHQVMQIISESYFKFQGEAEKIAKGWVNSANR